MPGYHVDVVDMGLAVDTAIEMGLESEEFTRRKKLPQGLVLSKMERRWFEGRRASSKSWICRRVELNAMSSPQLIEYIEDHLAAHDATAKVVPPNNVILSELDIQCRAAIRVILQDALEEMVDKDGITDKLTPRLYDTLTDIDGPSLTDDLEKNRVWSWRDALRRKVTEERLSQGDELSTAIQEAILEAVTEHQTNGVNDSGTNGHD